MSNIPFLKEFKTLNGKRKVMVVFVFILLMASFVRYVPWVVSSKPISALSYHELQNEPAPKWANSFAINHGRAIYYKDYPSNERPGKRVTLVIIFFLLFGLLLYLIYGQKRNT